MHERFSDRARHAMALANLEAGKLNHSDLRPAHLMLGLIAEGECVATEALRVLDVDLDKVRAEVSARMEKGEADGSLGRRAHTEELRAVINLAIQEARKFNHRYVGTEHLILGLLAHGKSIPAQVLHDQGLDPDKLPHGHVSDARCDGAGLFGEVEHAGYHCGKPGVMPVHD